VRELVLEPLGLGHSRFFATTRSSVSTWRRHMWSSRGRPRVDLAEFEGRYLGRAIGFDGAFAETFFELSADGGRLRMTGELGMSAAGSEELGLAFYRDDYVLVHDSTGKLDGFRANFERDERGRVAWLRLHGRYYEQVG
jgi:hypothetical protein